MTVLGTKDNSDIDLVEHMLKETGCIELHYKVQECAAEHKDWRKCQDVLKQFQLCMTEYHNRKKTADYKAK